MADKFSSPESSSSGGRANQSNGLYLTILKQPPAYVYATEEFDLEYAVEVGCENGSSIPSDIHVRASLEKMEQLGKPQDTATNESEPPLSTVHTHQSTAQLTEATLEIINQTKATSATGTSKIRCRIGLSGDCGGAYRIVLSADQNSLVASTRPIHLVRVKLQIEAAAEWNEIWYKDEGGRDKCIEILVEALESDKTLAKERLPLTLALCYAAEEPIRVLNQDVLRIIGSEKRLQIDKATGKAKIRFRIEDVSKNHQGQDFVLQVSVDKRLHHDIAPAYTPPVSVRSKRNKRHRAHHDPSLVLQEGSVASPAVSRDIEHALQNSEAPDVESVLDAVRGITKWADDVYRELVPLQWHVLGYSRNEDGSPDFSRPYHTMHNPNTIIARIRGTYMESTRRQLEVLERAMSRSSHVGTGSIEPYPRPMMHQDRYWMPPGPVPHMPPPVMHPHSMHRQGIDMNYEYPPLPLPPHAYSAQRLVPPSAISVSRCEDTEQMQETPQWHPHQASPRAAPLSSQSTKQLAASLHREREDTHDDMGKETDEVDIEYVLAKQYKSLHTRKTLGFPAYSPHKRLLGFFTSSIKADGSHFTSIHELDEDFLSPEVQQQTTTILQDAIDTKCETLYCLRHWGSISSLLDRVFVYDWSKDIQETENNLGTLS